jgi:hypothetical protein
MVLARRYVCVLSAAEALVQRVKAVIHATGWTHIPIAEVIWDGAAWIRFPQCVGVTAQRTQHDLLEAFWASRGLKAQAIL